MNNPQYVINASFKKCQQTWNDKMEHNMPIRKQCNVMLIKLLNNLSSTGNY